MSLAKGKAASKPTPRASLETPAKDAVDMDEDDEEYVPESHPRTLGNGSSSRRGNTLPTPVSAKGSRSMCPCL